MLSLVIMISAQAASISSIEANEIGSRIETQREEFNEKTAYPVGNRDFVAVSSIQIEALLGKADQKLESLISNDNLSKKEIAEKIKEINYLLMASERLIFELPY